MNRRVRGGIVFGLGLAVVAVVLQAVFLSPSGPSIEHARTVQCKVNRGHWVQEIARVLAAAPADEEPSWRQMLQTIADDDYIDDPRCRFCLHPYVFNPDSAAWAEDADPAAILIVCPGPHYKKPDTFMFATTDDGTAVEIPREQPPAWLEEGVRAEGVEGKQ